MLTFAAMIFELALTDEKVKPHQVTGMHLLSSFSFIGAAAVFYWSYLPIKGWEAALLIAGVSLLMITIIKNKWIRSPKPNKILRIFELMSMLCLGGYTASHRWWMATTMFGILAAALLFSLYWETNSNSTLTILISPSGIKLPITSRKRMIGWPEVDKVLLRYGTLTVDCANERWYQWNVQENDIDHTAFEHFCNNQVTINKGKRRNDDW